MIKIKLYSFLLCANKTSNQEVLFSLRHSLSHHNNFLEEKSKAKFPMEMSASQTELNSG